LKVSKETKQAYSEVYEIITLLDEDDRNKIPYKLQNYFKEQRDTEYVKNINLNIPIESQGLKRETLAIFAMLNLNYICDDSEEKKRLKKIYVENERKYQELLKEKYSIDNLFENSQLNEDKKAEEKIDNSKEKQLIVSKKENFIKRFLKFVSNIFKKKN